MGYSEAFRKPLKLVRLPVPPLPRGMNFVRKREIYLDCQRLDPALYSLLKPFREFVTVKLPSGRTDTFTR